jgi:SHS2 domain-containing protein
MWKVLDHTADLSVECSAPSWAELLAEAPRCLGSLVLDGPESGEPQRAGTESRALEVAGLDASETWVRWWRACLRLLLVEGLLPVGARVDPSSSETRALGVVECAPLAGMGPLHGADVKAVTWHGAAVESGDGGLWRGTIVLDV